MASKTLQIVGGLVVGVAALLIYQAQTAPDKYEELKDAKELPECSKEKLLNILEDLRIEYTPYYTHFYHMLVALASEYEDKPIL